MQYQQDLGLWSHDLASGKRCPGKMAGSFPPRWHRAGAVHVDASHSHLLLRCRDCAI